MLALTAFLFLAPRSWRRTAHLSPAFGSLPKGIWPARRPSKRPCAISSPRRKPSSSPWRACTWRTRLPWRRSAPPSLAYLLTHDPGRIDTGSLSKFRNFDWSATDDAAFAAQDPEAWRLLARVAELRKKNDGHPVWPSLREFMRAELSPGPAFRALMADLSENDRAVRKGLKDCRRG